MVCKMVSDLVLWQAGSFQLVWFSASAETLSSPEFYETLFDAEPDSIQSNRLPSGGKASAASGNLDGVNLQVSAQQGRIDVVVRPVPGPLPGSILIDRSDERLTWLLSKVKRLAAPPTSNRLALVVTYHQVASGPTQASAIINKALNEIVSFPDSSDLSFQVNRRRQFAFNDNIVMNRLIRYNVEAIQEVQFAGNAMVPSQTEVSVATFMIDTNTVPTRREYTPDDQAKIWDEFAAENRRIRDEGALSALGGEE